jgi:hypothetical protein
MPLWAWSLSMGYLGVLGLAALWAIVERMRAQAQILPLNRAVVSDEPTTAPEPEAQPEAA